MEPPILPEFPEQPPKQYILVVDDEHYGPYDSFDEARADASTKITWRGLNCSSKAQLISIKELKPTVANRHDHNREVRNVYEERERLHKEYLAQLEEQAMNENDNAQEVPAADPKSAHATPGGQPGDNTPEPQATETTVETPGGTTVTESPVADDSNAGE